MVIVEVLGTTVRPVVVAVVHAVAPLPDIVQVPLPMFKVRVLLLLEEKTAAVTLKFAAVNVPCVRVSELAVLRVKASASVTVMPEPLIVVLLMVLPTLVAVAVARNVGATEVYVPPEARVRSPAMFKLAAVTMLVLPVKFTFLNQLPEVIISELPPALIVRLGALVIEPPVVPNTTVAVVTNILRVKLPVPVQVKLVATAIDKHVPETLVRNTMFALPNKTERVLEFEEEKTPRVRVKLARSSVPCVRVNCPAFSASASVTVIPAPLAVVVPSVLPLLVIVPDARNVGTTDV